MNIKKIYGEDAKLIWQDRKRFCGLPLSFTRYYLIQKEGQWFKMFSNIGLLYSVIDEVNLYRVCDIKFNQSLFGKLFGTGTVVLVSSDESRPKLVLKNIKNPYQVRDMLSDYVEQQRKINNVRLTEFHAHE